MNSFNEEEFLDICKKLNPKAYSKEISIECISEEFFNKLKTTIEIDRRGEVVFAVRRPNGKIITITCEEYPKGIFRIPTGGISHDEDIIGAVHREVKEELGLETSIDAFIGVLKLRFIYENDSEYFYSYLFLMKERGGRLLVDAIDDEVAEVMEAGIDELKNAAHLLENIEDSWKDWGQFRFESTNAILEYIRLCSKE